MRSTPAASSYRSKWTAWKKSGSSISRMRPTTILQRSSLSAARPPVWAVRSAIPFRTDLCISGHACDRRCRSHRVCKRYIKGQAAPEEAGSEAAHGYSSYGNQIGLATGLVKEIYHPDYVAKRMEIGAVLGAAPRRAVIRENSDPGDIIILLGGRIGDATAAAAQPVLPKSIRLNRSRHAARKYRREIRRQSVRSSVCSAARK